MGSDLRLQGPSVNEDELFVDTSAWSLLLRRDRPTDHPVVTKLRDAIDGDGAIWTTGLILQELLQGFPRPSSATAIVHQFESLDFVTPTRDDHIRAATVVNECGRAGVQVKTVDALLAALCLDRSFVMVSADRDFEHIANHVPLRRWEAPAA